ncbi:MAG TPA: LTA synthase family protein [Rhodanobacteraceae bacterium]|nr:LTA synthase family protein [Rhodanobacteraceae bacterium]
MTVRRRVANPPAGWKSLLLVVLWLFAFVLWTDLIDGGAGVNPLLLLKAPWRLFANAVPGLLLALLLLALTRKVVLSVWLAWLVEALILGINALKIRYLATPLMPADFRMIGQMQGGGGELLSGYLPHSPWPWLAIAAAIAIIVLLALWEPPAFTRRALPRAALAALSLAALVSLFAAVPGWKKVYAAGKLGLQPWSARNTSRHTGLFSSLALYRLQYGNAQHTPDVAAARQLIASEQIGPATTASTSGPLPDIVIVQSESFFDPGILDGYTPLQFAPQLARLQRTGDSGWMYVPTFGGGTIRTEFEVLTGLSLRYYRNVQFPYLQFHETEIPSLVRTLKSHGYRTTALHANRPEFWNRTAAFKALGFDRFISISNFPPNTPTDGRYVSDKAMTDEILRQLKPGGPPQFIFAISIEAHGPYDFEPGIDTAARDAVPVPPSITGPWKLQLQNYIYHVQHADTQLGRLAQALAKRTRPSLLAFYGDHLPALVPAFQDAGFDNGKGFFEQCVPWLLVAPGHPHPPRRENLAAWMLPGLVLDAAGIHEPYFELTQRVVDPLAPLTRAPDAPHVDAQGPAVAVDKAMADVTWLRMRRKLKPLFAAIAPARPAAATSTATPAAASSASLRPRKPATMAHSSTTVQP